MPEIDGLEAASQIQERCPVPVVVLTAHESQDFVDKASEAGAAAYLTKPPKPAEIERAITIAIARHKDLMELRQLNRKIESGKSLLFFDEIQECPKAIMSLRYFYEEMPELHVIAAGSLLEFAMKDISFPVGRLQMLNMQPLTFKEFLWAIGKELLAAEIEQKDKQLSKTILNLVNEELYNYFLIGGMPECIQTFVQSRDYRAVLDTQTDLVATLRQDFSKYAEYSDKRCLNTVLTAVSRKTGEQIKYAHLDDNYSNPTIKKAFELLETARLFTRIKAASPSGIPLGSNVSDKKFKTVFLDIGLLSNLSGFNSTQIIPKQKLAAAFNGKLAEQFVGQELRATIPGDLYYWSRDARGSSAETDYLVQINGEILPIEVKSGKSGRLRSLHLLLETYPNVKKALVFTEDKYGELPDRKITFLPLFRAGII